MAPRGARRWMGTASVAVVFVVLAVVHVGGIGLATADSGTTISRCTEITEPGTYTIDDEFGAAGFEPSRPCILIRADDVILDGAGHTIDGPGATNTTGVQVLGADNVTIRNLKVTEWQHGVYYGNSTGGTVRNVTSTSNVYGIVVRDATGIGADEVNSSGNLVGIRLVRTADTGFPTVDTRSNRVGGVYAKIRVDGFLFSRTYGPPIDFDGDGLTEDVTGDGDATIGDRFALATIVTASYLSATDLTNDQVSALDFNGNGSLGFGDVLAY